MGWREFCNKLDNIDTAKVDALEKSTGRLNWKNFKAFIGPGFLVAIAYVDPGNLDADISAGSQFAYELTWVLFVSTIMGMIIQYMSAKLGIVSQNDLAQQCKICYKKPLRLFLWLMAEIAVISSDIPEVLGTAYALNLLFGIPLVLGIIITTLDTFLFLFLQYASIRILEVVIGAFLLIISSCFIIELFIADVNWVAMLQGFIPFFIPDDYRGRGGDASQYMAVSIGLLGSVIMPHNLFFHSALVKTRKIPRKEESIRESMIYNAVECFLALFVSFVINYSLIALAASTFFYDPNSGLNQASSLLSSLLGKFSSTVFAIALLASGQSSTITGTFAGQFVMEGFLDINIVPWKRSLITRSIAIIPSLLICILLGPDAADELIILSQMVLSIQLPFAVIPLLKMTSSPKIMSTKFTNGRALRITSVIISVIVILANISLLFIFFLTNINFSKTIGIIIFTIVMIIGIFYIGILIWLSTISVETSNLIVTPKFVESPNMEGNLQTNGREDDQIEIEISSDHFFSNNNNNDDDDKGRNALRSYSAPSSL